MIENATIINLEGKPLVAVLKVPAGADLSGKAYEHIQKTWGDLWQGKPPFPLLIMWPDFDFQIIVDPRK